MVAPATKSELLPLAIEAQQTATLIESGEIRRYRVGRGEGEPEHDRLRERLVYSQVATSNFAEMLRQCGQRYAQVSLDTYECTVPGQREAVDKLREYVHAPSSQAGVRKIPDIVSRLSKTVTADLYSSAAIAAGSSVLIAGPKGTGKDHLLISLARECVHWWGTDVRWINGLEMFRRLRSVAVGDAYESEVSWLTDVEVLYISDPLPPSGSLTEFQQAELFRIVDERYRHLRPTWLSLNVTDQDEAEKRLGAAVTDRLRDGALRLKCSWPSYRSLRN